MLYASAHIHNAYTQRVIIITQRIILYYTDDDNNNVVSRRVRVTRTLCAHTGPERVLAMRLAYAERKRVVVDNKGRCVSRATAIPLPSPLPLRPLLTHCCTGVSRQWCTIITTIVHGQRITLHYPPCRTSSGSRISSVWTTGSSVHTRVSARVIRHR